MSTQKDIVNIVKRLNQLNLNHAATGNVSVRKGAEFLITPSGTVADNINEKLIISCDLTITEQEVKRLNPAPSSEWHFHQAIYHKRPDINAIIHTHSVYASAVSVLREKIPPFHYMIAMFGGNEILCADYALFGTKNLSKNIITSLGDRYAVLLSNHGSIVVGKDLQHAFYLIQELEHLAHQFIELKKIGKLKLLSMKEMKEVHIQFSNYGPQLKKR
ncbi:MAG: class II aldolase/adducin family protein [Nitrosomonadales bacterium]|jgi:L-fuculose-phosphate aldolase